MNLLEYEAKEILRNYAIPVPKSFIATDNPLFLPAIIKSQVPIGGRGKAALYANSKSTRDLAFVIHKSLIKYPYTKEEMVNNVQRFSWRSNIAKIIETVEKLSHKG